MSATLTSTRLPRTHTLWWVNRSLVTALGLLAAGAVLGGVLLPWIYTFAGLISQNAWGTHNGNILVVLAGLTAAAAVGQLLRPTSSWRWALAVAGLGTAAFSAYLLIQLYAALAKVEGMAFASRGPGLYLCIVGGVIAFGTIFLPTADRTTDAVEAPVQSMRVGISQVGVAVLALVGALAHLPVTPEHLQEVPYIGWLFVALMVVLILGATALLIREHVVVYVGLALACGLTVIGYAVSRSVGLPGMSDDIGHWLEPLGVVACLGELGAVAWSVVAIRGLLRRTTPGTAND